MKIFYDKDLLKKTNISTFLLHIYLIEKIDIMWRHYVGKNITFRIRKIVFIICKY